MNAENRNLLAFLGLAFGWSWLIWAPRVFAARGMTGLPEIPNVGAFGPTVAAFVLVFVTGGLPGVSKLAKRAIDVSFRLPWVVPAVLLFPAINGGILLVQYLLGGGLPTLPWVEQPTAIPVAFVVVLLTTGPLQEEFGWRGYALDPLQDRFSALVASIVLGLIWAAWHVPLFFFGEAIIYRPENAIGFVPSVILVTILITWIYNNTGGSLLTALLAHASFNFSHWALPVLETDFAREAYLLVLLGVTAGIVLLWGPSDLSRNSAEAPPAE